MNMKDINAVAINFIAPHLRDVVYKNSPFLFALRELRRTDSGISPVEVRWIRPDETPATAGYRQATFVSDARVGEVLYWTQHNPQAVSAYTTVGISTFAGVAVNDQKAGDLGLVMVRGFMPGPQPVEYVHLSEVGEWPGDWKP